MIAIRAPKPEDVAPLTEAANLPGVRRGTLRMPYTSESFMRERLLEPSPHAKPLVASWEGLAVGQGSLLLRFGRQRHVGEVFLFVHDEFWGRGVGRALLEALLDHADNWYGLRRVELDVAADNSRAIALYESFGFEHEGTKRGDTLTEGRLDDSHMMARLRPAPERAAP